MNIWRVPLCGHFPAFFPISKILFIYGFAPYYQLTKAFKGITSGPRDANISKALSVVKHNLSPYSNLLPETPEIYV